MTRTLPAILTSEYTSSRSILANGASQSLAETGENYLIACNFSDKDAAFTIPADFAGARRLIGNYPDTAPTGAVTLRPYEAFVLQK